MGEEEVDGRAVGVFMCKKGLVGGACMEAWVLGNWGSFHWGIRNNGEWGGGGRLRAAVEPAPL